MGGKYDKLCMCGSMVSKCLKHLWSHNVVLKPSRLMRDVGDNKYLDKPNTYMVLKLGQECKDLYFHR
jgi:hypothetical protein